MQVQFVPRTVWGASLSTEQFIANRVSDSIHAKTEIHVHHTAAIDGNDATPNRWDYSEAVAYMKLLETVRPELGPLPYSENYAISEDLSVVWVFQGRGWLKRGAHTGGHNVSGVGLGALGNFNNSDPGAATSILNAMEVRVAQERNHLYRLGEAKNPHGWNAWGHKDSKATSCPGSSLYWRLENFRLDNEGEDMPTAEEIAQAVVAAMPTLDDVSQAVWSMGNRTGAISVWLALDRIYRNVGELVIAHRAGNLGTTAMAERDDDDLVELVEAIVDEQARRLAS